MSRSLATDFRGHRGNASAGGRRPSISSISQRRGFVRTQRAGHCPSSRIPAGHRITDGLQFQVWAKSAVGIAFGHQSDRSRPIRTQIADTFQTISRPANGTSTFLRAHCHQLLTFFPFSLITDRLVAIVFQHVVIVVVIVVGNEQRQFGEFGDGRPARSLLETVCALEELAVQKDEARVAPQHLPGPLQDPRTRSVRGPRHRETHDGHRIHRRDDPGGAGRVPREALRRGQPRHLHVPAGRAPRHRRHALRRPRPLHQSLVQPQLRRRGRRGREGLANHHLCQPQDFTRRRG